MHRDIQIWLKSVDSTMEYAKSHAEKKDYFMVIAQSQNKGRGTRGRSWSSPIGNLYTTIGIQNSLILKERAPLLPLDVGCVLFQSIRPFLPENGPTPFLKWPNDLLIDEKKIAGVLLESTPTHLFIGIGINLTHAPLISDNGRTSGSLHEFGAPKGLRKKLANRIFSALRQRINTPFVNAELINEWSSYAQWNQPMRLRATEGQKGKWVLPKKINGFGQLLVCHENGTEEWLTSTYLD